MSQLDAIKQKLERGREYLNGSTNPDEVFVDGLGLRGPQSTRYKLLSSEDLSNLPPLKWLVRGVLPAQGLAACYGPSGAGKSFLVLDLAAAIAEGAEWFGYRVTPSPVCYAALEGEAGFRQRVEAWKIANGRPLPKTLRLVLQPFRLTNPSDLADLAAAISLMFPSGAVVVVDTLNRAAPDADENASADMGQLIESARHLQSLTGHLVLLVHHSGKDATKGLRGHSSLGAVLDASIEVSRSSSSRQWRTSKVKDGPDEGSHSFKLVQIEVGHDEDGIVTSCVVRPDESFRETAKRIGPKGVNQKLVLEKVKLLLNESSHFGKSSAPTSQACINLEEAVSQISTELPCEPKRQTERTRQALDGLITAGYLACGEGWLWLS